MLCEHCTPFEVVNATPAVHLFYGIGSMWCDSRGVMCDIGAWSGRLTRRGNAPFGVPLSALPSACYKRQKAATGGQGGNVANARRNHPSKARTATQHNVKESEATQSNGGDKRWRVATAGDGPQRGKHPGEPIQTERSRMGRSRVVPRCAPAAEQSRADKSREKHNTGGHTRRRAANCRHVANPQQVHPCTTTQS